MNELVFPCICGQSFPVGRDRCPYCDVTFKVAWYWNGKQSCEVAVYDNDKIIVGLKGEKNVRQGITKLPEGLTIAFSSISSKRPTFYAILKELIASRRILLIVLIISIPLFCLFGLKVPLLIASFWLGFLALIILEIAGKLTISGYPRQWESWLKIK